MSARREPDPWMDQLEWLMDRSIRIGPWRIGLDGILGLVPGVGDYLGMAAASIIVARAATMGIPKSALARMLANLLLDGILGVIPVIGDVFDFAYKPSMRNMRILREALAGQRRARRDWGFVALVAGGFLAVLALPFVLIVTMFGIL